MTDAQPITTPSEDQVSDEAFAALEASVAALAERLRSAVALPDLAEIIAQAVQPYVASLALNERVLTNATFH